jgi:signal peptide peptidase-like protein 2B
MGCTAVGLAVFFTRHEPYAWIANNVMASAYVCTLLRFVRVPSLRVAATLLGLFFFYDVFMVFFSPYVFGKSVMLEVVMAGDPPQPHEDEEHHCIRELKVSMC